MFHLWKNRDIHQPDGIEIKQSPLHGKGVFACKQFNAGNVIETAPVILLEQEDKDFLQTSTLYRYYFVVNDKKYPVVLGLGCSSLCNHAGKANAVYSISLKNASLTIRAFKTINPGEEITLNYNGLPDDETAVYFPPDSVE